MNVTAYPFVLIRLFLSLYLEKSLRKAGPLMKQERLILKGQVDSFFSNLTNQIGE